ncbi:sulfur oxidation c-type cytochrome SoxX [Ralstonia syzygii subsp. celebesensis]|uniref:Sulfur oxidation c-type cytochrome SoxX n=2 Tax=Ralstonia syzygii subsp. celebesensis TaxID=1310168 RepID=A0A1U9VJB5_9RALS|nr:sulfur oxidation c-type cytochrome SoxX [Ralstonia syzygii]AQW30363.1 sulfur oxidation c-type cytochrome SoxX [blood disease bacterium A2-HR MARDI]AXW60742.1 sulfur oxidation c-type cytochrome SoxX [Ralstonia solanacearum]QQV55808.1 sulfur oxidation c-type cytochrome SoxX [Ralstonia syzygii subsp. celebesensis]CCA80912.1 putative cytochrome of the thiosulfate-oxidizing multi-enzyme system, soxX homolog [blood disease bacterium R229]
MRPRMFRSTLIALACAAGTAHASDAAVITPPKPDARADAALTRVIRDSFVSKGPATVAGVTERDDVQKTCSQYADRNTVPAEVAAKLQDAQLKTIRYPQDGKWLGDWKGGEQIAQSGRGMQFSDPAGTVNGANCYACHRLSKDEVSYGTIGPSLYQYGKLRGDSEAILRYTWGKIYNSNAYAACSNMPRFGHKGILTEQQIRDVMALLFDPASPVNQ